MWRSVISDYILYMLETFISSKIHIFIYTYIPYKLHINSTIYICIQNLLLDSNGNVKISDFGLSSLYVGDADAEGEYAYIYV
jgi:serine/threonine protein kinase